LAVCWFAGCPQPHSGDHQLLAAEPSNLGVDCRSAHSDDIAIWRMKNLLPELERIIVYETQDCFAEYSGM
jgi:hypothetical protein